MKSVRLLPIVIFAAVALLIFKGVGLVTNGGYVLIGTTTAEAAGGGGGSHGGGSGTTEGVADDGFASLIDPTMTDASPTAEDTAPTLPLGDEPAAGGHGAPAAGEHGATAAAEGEHGAPAEGDVAAAEGEHGAEPAAEGAHAEGAEVPVEGEHAVAAEETACPPEGEAAASAPAGDHGAAPEAEVVCDPNAGLIDGVAQPVVQDADGKLVPFAPESSTASAVEQRLGERRANLDAREQELDMRLALVEAAEKRINDRTAVLQQLEARINSLVDQNKEAEEGQFKSIVSLYETMKPKEAALIFDELDMNTLLRVSRAMNPRKLAPIMAKMSPVKAKDLTASMAITPAEPQVAVTAEDLAALPQIVGQ
jgi:flagellar motility protein MotE (MotC chaperone)